MGREKKRKRSRSNTPPVEWETLLVPPIHVAPVAGVPIETVEPPRAEVAPKEQAGSSRQAAAAETAREGPSEREAWRALVLKLAAVRGDKQMDQLLAEKHPELVRIAEECGALGSASCSIEQARDHARNWFEKALRGSNRHGSSEKAAICTRLTDILKARLDTVLAEVQGDTTEAAAAALRRGKAEEEGPLICALIAKELEGSRYEGIWVSRSGHGGRFIIGDEAIASGLPDKDADGANIDRVIRVAIKVVNGKITVDGFFHKGESDMNPVKCQVGPFLTVYFEGLSLKEAFAKWKDGPHGRDRPKAPAFVSAQPGLVVRGVGDSGSNQDRNRDSLKALAATLPPGWELRESRSKKGVYYYANPSKGLSQHERPKV